jgi:MHS family proline/betaine transporter-like MFS transporter
LKILTAISKIELVEQQENMEKTAEQTSLAPQPSFRRLILVGLIGNVMEWYDFAVYGFFAVTIGRLFFPAEKPIISLIAAFGAFAAGFLVRPIGGIVFGRIGDLMGRQRAMLLSVIAMAIPTVLMGMLPTFDTIGIAAPILLVSLRLVQGLSVGGEYTSSLVFLVENGPQDRRAYSAVWGAWGASAGTLLGSGVGFLMAALLTSDNLESWGWRVPFVLGGCVAFVGLLLRRGLHAEAPVARSKNPTREIFTKHRWAMLRVALLNLGFGAAFYTVFVYTVSFLEQFSKLSNKNALRNNSIAMIVLLLIMPMAAKFADRQGRRVVLGVGFTALTVLAIPLFYLMSLGVRFLTISCELALAIPIALISGAIAATNVELMPRAVRCTGLAFAYNISVGVLGGMTPMIVTWLIAYSHSPAAPGYWIAATSAVSAITLFFFVHETKNHSLEDPETGGEC